MIFSHSNLVHSQSIPEQKVSSDLTLYLFLLDDCPICIEYTHKLNELYSTFGKEVQFKGYFPNFSSKPHKIETFKKEYSIDFELNTDYYKKQSQKWNAQVTPEVILFDEENEIVVYRGRIDNKFFKLGKRRNVVTSNELEDALKAAIEGKLPAVRETEAIGCFINYNDLKISR